MIVEGLDKALSLHVTRKVGYSQNFGRAHFGWCLFGLKDTLSGIYQRYHNYGKRHIRKIAFYWPTNPRTVPQQTRRDKFAAAISTWQGLTTLQKSAYNIKATERRMSGYNLFIREYMYA